VGEMDYTEIKNATVYISEDKQKVVITGYPQGEEHNCDAMGCGQSHVIVRAKITKLGM